MLLSPPKKKKACSLKTSYRLAVQLIVPEVMKQLQGAKCHWIKYSYLTARKQKNTLERKDQKWA